MHYQTLKRTYLHHRHSLAGDVVGKGAGVVGRAEVPFAQATALRHGADACPRGGMVWGVEVSIRKYGRVDVDVFTDGKLSNRKVRTHAPAIMSVSVATGVSR